MSLKYVLAERGWAQITAPKMSGETCESCIYPHHNFTRNALPLRAIAIAIANTRSFISQRSVSVKTGFREESR